jgi:hypothetical protein
MIQHVHYRLISEYENAEGWRCLLLRSSLMILSADDTIFIFTCEKLMKLCSMSFENDFQALRRNIGTRRTDDFRLVCGSFRPVAISHSDCNAHRSAQDDVSMRRRHAILRAITRSLMHMAYLEASQHHRSCITVTKWREDPLVCIDDFMFRIFLARTLELFFILPWSVSHADLPHFWFKNRTYPKLFEFQSIFREKLVVSCHKKFEPNSQRE